MISFQCCPLEVNTKQIVLGMNLVCLLVLQKATGKMRMLSVDVMGADMRMFRVSMYMRRVVFAAMLAHNCHLAS